MHDDGHARRVAELLDELVVELRLLVVHAVHGAEGGCECGHARALHELLRLRRLGVERLVGDALARVAVLVARHDAELALDAHAALLGELHDLRRAGDVLLVGEGRAVDHHRVEANVEAAGDVVDVLAVVDVQHKRRLASRREGQHGGPDVVDREGALVHLSVLQDDGNASLLGRRDRAEEPLEVGGVDRRDGDVVLLCVAERFVESDEHVVVFSLVAL